MSRHDELEKRLGDTIHQLMHDFADLGGELRWSITRALIHRAVHFATERPGVDFCALAMYLGEMVGHAHNLAHGKDPKAPIHGANVH